MGLVHLIQESEAVKEKTPAVFRIGQMVIATGIEFPGVFPICVAIAARSHKDLTDALDWLHMSYDTCKFVRVKMVPHKRRVSERKP